MLNRFNLQGCQFSVYIVMNISDPQSSYPTYISAFGKYFVLFLLTTITIYCRITRKNYNNSVKETEKLLQFRIHSLQIYNNYNTMMFFHFYTCILYSFTNVINITKRNLHFTFFLFFSIFTSVCQIRTMKLAYAPLFPTTLNLKIETV